MICPKCGSFVNENTKECWNCHTKIGNYGGLTDVSNNYRERDPSENRNVITVGDWIVTFILLAIPIINIVMPFIWAFSSSTPLSKKNYGKAILILWAVTFVILILFWGSILGSLNEVSRGSRI